MQRKPAANAPLPGIEHIIVVMFENRSFDNVLGALHPPSDSFWGIPTDAYNQWSGGTVYPSTTPTSSNSLYITPYPDPNELFDDMTAQIFDGQPIANMMGFAANYATVKHATPGDIMVHFTPDTLPVSNGLGQMFAVCDQWFGSGPVQTFPNRSFAMCGTPSTWWGKSEARVNDIEYLVHPHLSIEAVAGSVPDGSIFQLLDGNSGTPDPANWKVYFHDCPLSLLSKYVNDAFLAGSPCVASFDGSDYDPPYGTSTFVEDVQNGTLPTYSLIEPRYYDDYSGSGLPASSNHPGKQQLFSIFNKTPIDVRYGELLLLEIYALLAENAELFAKTLLIVTYDEHGGVWDHVAPNAPPFAASVPSPFSYTVDGFDYTRLGPRVPAILINPRIPSSTVFRPQQPASGPFYPYEHVSLISTLRAQFGLGDPLTPRDATAPVITGLPMNTARTKSELTVPAAWREWAAAVPRKKGKPARQKTPAEHNEGLVHWAKSKRK